MSHESSVTWLGEEKGCCLCELISIEKSKLVKV